jgi:hypothetical protein
MCPGYFAVQYVHQSTVLPASQRRQDGVKAREDVTWPAFLVPLTRIWHGCSTGDSVCEGGRNFVQLQLLFSLSARQSIP